MQRNGGIEAGEVFFRLGERDPVVVNSPFGRHRALNKMASNQVITNGLGAESLRSPLSVLRYWGPVFLYAGVIFLASSMSSPPESVSSFLGETSDKVLHLGEYGLLGALAYRACRHGAGAWVADHAVIVAVAGCALYGLSDEIHQLFVPLREGDPLDLVADSIGATLGAWTWRLLHRRAVQSPL